MEFIRAKRKDIDKITEIECNSGYHKNPNKIDIRKLFVKFFNSTEPYALILEVNKNKIGYFAFRIVRNNCELNYLALDRKYQGKGFGKLLLNKILSLSKKMNIKKIKLSVRQNNVRAINLYKKYGFEIVGRNSKNKLFMERILK